MAENADTFDYVIVGSGAAGSVLCNRLTEDPNITVCVLESGPPDRHPYIPIPAGFIKMLFNPAYTGQFKTEPADGVNGRPTATPHGRTLGGRRTRGGIATLVIHLRAHAIAPPKQAFACFMPQGVAGPIVAVVVGEAGAAQAGGWKVVHGQPFGNRRNQALVIAVADMHSVQVIGR